MMRLVGLLVMIVGLAGVVACASGAAGLWLVSLRFSESLEKASDRIGEFATDIEGRTEEAKKIAGKSREQVGQFRDRLQFAIDRGEDLDPAEVAKVEARLRSYIGEVRGWTGAISNARELVQLFASSVDSAASVVVDERRKELKKVLAEVFGHIGEAESELGRLTSELERSDSLEEKLQLLERCENALSSLERGADSFSSSLNELDTTAEKISETMSKKSTLWVMIGSGILVWLALGQWCLSGWGLRKLRGK